MKKLSKYLLWVLGAAGVFQIIAPYADCPHSFLAGKEYDHESEVTRCTIHD